MKPVRKYSGARMNINDLDGSAFGTVVRASGALRTIGVTHDEIGFFQQEGLLEFYENVVSTTMNWVHASRKRGQPCVNPELAGQFKGAANKAVLLQNSQSANITLELVQ